MPLLTITKLARRFGLSRSTLLYYDRIGLLSPSGRTSAGYRIYREEDAERLERIHRLRAAGLALADIAVLLARECEPECGVLQKRLREVGEEILDLTAQQKLLAQMIGNAADGECPPKIDKAMWIEMLRAAGLDDAGMNRWHTEFERRAPEAHARFLASLGLAPAEVERIRRWSGMNSCLESA